VRKPRGSRCGGGVINKPRGKIVTNYAWGLGSLTNNEVEALALYVGINLALSNRINNLIICGDSMLVIRAIVHKNITGGNIYKGIMSHILDILKNFEKTTLYHIKRDHNEEADKNAKVGSRLRKGKMLIKGELRIQHIP
jgi:ribonuclease HI